MLITDQLLTDIFKNLLQNQNLPNILYTVENYLL